MRGNDTQGYDHERFTKAGFLPARERRLKWAGFAKACLRGNDGAGHWIPATGNEGP